MSALNTKEIRNRLPYGSIARIAKELEIEPRIVSEVLNKGWHSDVKNAVLDSAMSILEEEHSGQADLIERAEEINLSKVAFNVPAKYKRKKKADEDNPGGAGTVIIIASIIGLLLWFLMPGFKDKIKSLFASKSTEVV